MSVLPRGAAVTAYTDPMRAPKAFDPRRLDVAAFAKAGGHLDGCTPLRDLRRLAEAVLDDPSAEVPWTLDGNWRQPAGDEPQWRVHLKAAVTVHMTCQRCLETAPLALSVDRRLRFVMDEREAEALDEASEDEDVLVLPSRLQVAQLLEDELILTLPIVPRHDLCPNPLPVAADLLPSDVPDAAVAGESAASDDPPPANPFAALAALKTARKPG